LELLVSRTEENKILRHVDFCLFTAAMVITGVVDDGYGVVVIVVGT
jgi:hypothetical protein